MKQPVHLPLTVARLKLFPAGTGAAVYRRKIFFRQFLSENLLFPVRHQRPDDFAEFFLFQPKLFKKLFFTELITGLYQHLLLFQDQFVNHFPCFFLIEHNDSSNCILVIYTISIFSMPDESYLHVLHSFGISILYTAFFGQLHSGLRSPGSGNCAGSIWFESFRTALEKKQKKIPDAGDLFPDPGDHRNFVSVIKEPCAGSEETKKWWGRTPRTMVGANPPNDGGGKPPRLDTSHNNWCIIFITFLPFPVNTNVQIFFGIFSDRRE